MRVAWPILLLMLSACGEESIFNAAGPVSGAERIILLDSVAIMLAIIIPVMIATLAFAWWFRASNEKAKYRPRWAYSGWLEIMMWAIPLMVILFLGGIGWRGAHELDPAKPLDPHAKPLEIQVVSLDWKWLFIYPGQQIASVNRLPVPVGVPLHFSVTSASVFNVFFVPRIGSEIYAMNGMTTNLNLEADKPGKYPGLSADFSGDGFSTMHFDMEAMPPEQFADWVRDTKTSGMALDEAAYRELMKQSMAVKPYTYRTVDAGLFDAIARQQLPPGPGPNIMQPGKEE